MLAEAVRRREELEREEERYWREYSRHKHKLLQAEDEYRYLTYKQKFTTDFGIGLKVLFVTLVLKSLEGSSSLMPD